MPAALGVAFNSFGSGGVSGSVGRVTTSDGFSPSPSFLPSFESDFFGSDFDLLEEEEDGFELGGFEPEELVDTFGAALLERMTCGCAPAGANWATADEVSTSNVETARSPNARNVRFRG